MTALDTPPPLAAVPVVAAARRLAEQVLAPRAEQVDRDGLDREQVQPVLDAGVLAVADEPAAVQREVQEILSAACGTTWFVTAQHHTPTRTVLDSPNAALRERWAEPLRRGRALAAVAFTHLRRPGPPPVTATRQDDGWRFDGRVSWLTSWGLADVLLLAAQAGDDAVFALVPARGQPGLSASPPLPLAAMGGTGTVSLRLDGLMVPDPAVARVVPLQEWRPADAARTANATPGAFGLLRGVARQLGEREPAAAAEVAARAAALRERAYRLVDDVPAGERLDERVAVRAAVLELAVRSSAALVAAGGGRAMGLDQPAQRLAREALFHLVQAQTPQVRAATVGRLTAPAAEPSGADGPARR